MASLNDVMSNLYRSYLFWVSKLIWFISSLITIKHLTRICCVNKFKAIQLISEDKNHILKLLIHILLKNWNLQEESLRINFNHWVTLKKNVCLPSPYPTSRARQFYVFLIFRSLFLLLFCFSQHHKQCYKYSSSETPPNMHVRHITQTKFSKRPEAPRSL